MGHPVIRIIGPQGYRQDEDHPQGGLARGCRLLPVLVLVLAWFSLLFFFFQWKPISNINLSWDWLGRPEE